MANSERRERTRERTKRGEIGSERRRGAAGPLMGRENEGKIGGIVLGGGRAGGSENGRAGEEVSEGAG